MKIHIQLWQLQVEHRLKALKTMYDNNIKRQLEGLNFQYIFLLKTSSFIFSRDISHVSIDSFIYLFFSRYTF